MFSTYVIDGVLTLVKTVIVKGKPVHYSINPETGVPIDIIELPK